MQGSLVDLDFRWDARSRIRFSQRVLCLWVILVVIGGHTMQHVSSCVGDQQMRTIVGIGRQPTTVERGWHLRPIGRALQPQYA